VVCRNPDLAAERSRKREELLAATERDLARVQAAVARSTATNAARFRDGKRLFGPLTPRRSVPRHALLNAGLKGAAIGVGAGP
jgi:hypothetical protein